MMEQLIKRAILAGILVGIGVVVNISVENRYIGAMLFSFALLTIIKCSLNLYTGKIGFYQTQKPVNLAIMLMFNLVGVSLPTLGIALCRESAYEAIVTASNAKFGNSLLSLFIYGILCGVLMFIAVYAKDTVITVFCIMIFILSGFEHCIADFIYLVLNFSAGNFVKFAAIVLGNSIGSMFIHFLVSEKQTA